MRTEKDIRKVRDALKEEKEKATLFSNISKIDNCLEVLNWVLEDS